MAVTFSLKPLDFWSLTRITWASPHKESGSAFRSHRALEMTKISPVSPALYSFPACPRFDIILLLDNASFMDLLTGNNVDCGSTFDFVDHPSDTSGLQWSSHGSVFANSDGFSEYSGVSGTRYSSEGDNAYSESLNLDLADFGSLDMFLPIPEIQTASPPPAAPLATLQSTGSEVPTLKRPRAAVAADLDTDNILPLEHRRKRVKPARADVHIG